MTGRAFVLAGLALAVPGPLRADDAAEAALHAELAAGRRDLMQAELELERAKRLLPPDLDLVEEEGGLHRRAARAGLRPLEVRRLPDGAPPRLDDGGPTGVALNRFEVSGRGPYEAVHAFFTEVAGRPRLTDLEALRVEAGADGSVAFAARLVLPTFAGTPPAPPTASVPVPWPDAARSREALAEAMSAQRQAVLRRAIDENRRHEGATRSVLRTLTDLSKRRTLARLSRALATSTRALDDRALALVGVHFEDEVTVTGVALGGAARDALRPALEQAGFEVTGLQVTPSGRCHAFSVTARLRAEEPPVEVVHGNGLFDEGTASVCRPEPTPPLGRVAAGGGGTVGGRDGLTVRLRDVELADAFWVLHEVAAEGFVVASDVQGRLDLDLEGATAEDVWAGLGRVGLSVGPGPIRQISRAPGRAAGEAATYSGDPVRLSLRRTAVVDLLRLFQEITGLTFLAPHDLRREVSIFTGDVPWDHCLEAILTAAGLTYRIDGSRVFVGPEPAIRSPGHPGFIPVQEARRDRPRRDWWTRTGRLEDTGVHDLALVGVGRTAGGWQAWAYGPSRHLWLLAPGQLLAGASVTSVGPTGVTLQAAGQEMVELPFPP